MNELLNDNEFKQLINSIVNGIKADVSDNKELLRLYWFIGSQIIEKQKTAKCGDGFLKQLSKDLQKDFPEMKGFSYRNIKQWYLFWYQEIEIVQRVVAQLDSAKTKQVVSQSQNTKGQQADAQLDNVKSFVFQKCPTLHIQTVNCCLHK